MTSRRTKQPTPAGQAARVSLGDRHTANEYARELHEETLRSLKRDPSRWKWPRSNELPSRRGTEPEAPP